MSSSTASLLRRRAEALTAVILSLSSALPVAARGASSSSVTAGREIAMEICFACH